VREREGYGLAAAYLVALKVDLLNVAISIQVRNESGYEKEREAERFASLSSFFLPT